MRLFLILLVLGGAAWGIKKSYDSGHGVIGGLKVWREQSAEGEEVLVQNVPEKMVLDEPVVAEKKPESETVQVLEAREKAAEEEFVVVVRQFRNRSVPSLEMLVANSQLAGGVEWMVNLMGNQVIARVRQKEAALIDAMLGAMDVVGSQFRVEAVIGFVNITDGEEFSLDWVLKYTDGDRLNLAGTALKGSPGQVQVKTDWMDLAVNRLSEMGKLDVVARPSIILSSGETGKISSGREIAVPVSNLQNGNVRTSIEFRRVALTLEVGLVEIGEGVELKVNQISEDVSGETEVDGNLIPEIASQVWESRFRPVLNEWYAVGGLKGQEVREFKQRGLLGLAFRKDQSNSRREIALLVRVVPSVAENEVPRLAVFDPLKIEQKDQDKEKKGLFLFRLPVLGKGSAVKGWLSRKR